MAKRGRTEGKRPSGAPNEVWAEAVRRAALVAPLAGEGRLTRARVHDAARELGLSVPRAYRLIALYREVPVTASLVPTRPGPAKGTRRLPPGVEDVVERAIEASYKQRERPTLARLRSDVDHDCKTAKLKPPSRKALSARVSARPLREMVRAREGVEAARQRFAPVRPGPRPGTPLPLVQADHTRVDLVLVDAATRVPLGRPWLTLVLDVCTRCVLGLHVAFDAPSSTGVALAMAQAVLAKDDWLASRDMRLAWPMHGLPGTLHMDNGPEFRARALRQGCQQHGVHVDYRPPATPRFGGHIERLMGTLMRRVHALPGTTFSNVAERGSYPSERRAVLSLAEFKRVLALEVLGPCHNDVHSALGKTPAAAWAEGIGSAPPRLPRDRDAFVLDFLPWEERVVRRDGVRLFRIAYYDGALASLIGEPARKVRVKYDPRDLGAVFVGLPEGGHVRVPYADLAHPPISLWEHREAVRRLREMGKRTVGEQAIFEGVDGQRRILAEASAATKAARRSDRSAASLALHPAPAVPAPVSAGVPAGAGRGRRGARAGDGRRRGVEDGVPDVSATAHPHLHPAVRELADRDDVARIAHVRAKRWVEHRAASGLLELLDEVFEQPSSERMENLLILGESGMGKTALLRAFERRHAAPWDEARGVRPWPVLVVRMPPVPTEKELFLKVLETLGVPPDLGGGNAFQRREATFQVLREVGTRVLVLDEINSVLAGGAGQQRLFLQLLRFLSNELGVALVCAGVPEARHALMSDAQLRTRCGETGWPPWSANADLQDFVNRLVQGFPLRQPSPVDGAKVRRLLAARSGGTTVRICKALERAAVAAIRGGRERIDLAALEDEAAWRAIAPARAAPGQRSAHADGAG